MNVTGTKWETVSGGVTAARGFLAAGVSAGIKYKGRKDVALVYSEVPASAAGVFTTNRVKAAPLLVTIEHIRGGCAQAIVINSGNANACNGEQGLADAQIMAKEVARLLEIPQEYVLVASTGIIGQPLPLDRVVSGIVQACEALDWEGGSAAAEAIMTTDTEPKEFALSFSLEGQKVAVGGMAKGAGMIHPNLATMLCFITTDAAVSPQCLKQMLCHAVDRSFNMITVDGDTSTNDMVVVLANGLAGNPEITSEGEDFELLREALTQVCTRLAIAIVQDGEGATRLMEVQVVNAFTEKDARLAARAVAGSNLVKTSIFGQDANWGRILCAIGYSGAEFEPDRVDIFLGGVQVAKDGCALPFHEEEVASVLAGDAVPILIDLKCGSCSAFAWGCDLSYDYVRINAHYRT